MQCVCIGQDHKDSSTKSGRDPSRREAGEGAQDVMGPFRLESLSGFRFCIVFADQYTKFVFVELLKSEALASLRKFVLSVGTPKKLRQDKAKEFLSEQFKRYCLDAGILQEKTIPETPQQNGLA